MLKHRGWSHCFSTPQLDGGQEGVQIWGPGQDTKAFGLPRGPSQGPVGRGERTHGPQSSYLSLETIQAGNLGRGGVEHPAIAPSTSVQNSDPTGMALFWTKTI